LPHFFTLFLYFYDQKSDPLDDMIILLSQLFIQWSGNEPDTIVPLPPSGSERKYFRFTHGEKSAIGAWNPVVEENEAFFYFSKHFYEKGLHVPELYGVDPSKEAYLIEDLGNTSLFSLVENNKHRTSFPDDLVELYRKSLMELVRFQVVADKDLDYSYCYPHSSFDARSMKWDLNYFKYYFLKLHVPFHEGRLEDDFDTLVDFLCEAESNYFMYRDFQSRNIFIKDNKPYFIDYQGGRKGPLQYDVASLLFQVKADLPFDLRETLLDDYISELSKHISINKEGFKKHYYGFVLMRLLQVLGAYGFRGLIEKKPHFLASIPFALKNLNWWLDKIQIGTDMPELLTTLRSLTALKQYQFSEPVKEPKNLTVSIRSFSYKQGIPVDNTGNGGGFVFDCRALPNPGREERYRAFNGKDQVIVDYLKDEPAVRQFLDGTEKVVSQSVENYLERGFNSLSVAFGCTGGQHRSVYCAETMAVWLREKYREIVVSIEHLNI
jgi:aminoglycoside/choline kinase family phosphotransferase